MTSTTTTTTPDPERGPNGHRYTCLCRGFGNMCGTMRLTHPVSA